MIISKVIDFKSF
jgi:hypothetical protein